MVTEVNKIAADALAREHALHLPGVGSLVVERRPAERLSSRRMRRAYLAVTFTSQQRGVSLVARIAAVAAVDIARAQDIYDRWLAKCGGGPTLVIEGVGRLDRKSFLVEEVFDRVLNPAGRGEVAVGRYSRHIFGAVVAGVCIAVLAVTLGIGLYYTGFGDMMADMSGIFSRTERVRSAAGEAIVADNGPAAAGLPDGAADEMPAADTKEAADADKRVDTVPGGEPERPAAEQLPQSSQTEQPVRDVRPAAVAESQAEDAVGRLSSGCSYVVLGVFSTPENAVRAVAEARAKHGVEGGGAFVYGPKYLAALYFDMDRERCAEYARSATQFSDLWIYTAR
ncbi:MAG: hypothetical protein K2J51_05915 [Alistipes sp.]|nr:hypothetical protein [Alistipes sp.]